MWVTHIISTEVWISTQEWLGDETAWRLLDLVLVKRDMLRCVQDARTVRGMGRGLSDLYVVLCKVRLVGAWSKRREVVVGVRRIRSEKLREHQYREGYARSLEGKGVEWDGDNNVEHM